jgi:hypothetical protein
MTNGDGVSSEPVTTGEQPAEPNQLGKRYSCTECDAQLLCVTAGAGRFSCHGRPMELLAPKRLPASD